ncbi:MAG: flagellar motor protein MotB [Candidatus Schekmanbacteria bacterium]|nr:flagellar motor protein MotB [Candidatus Schekmanbacteria bacterium]
MADDREPAVEGAPDGAWMLTFSDMTTLLLTFFVMLVGMGSMKEEKLAKLSSEFRQQAISFGVAMAVSSEFRMENPIAPIVPAQVDLKASEARIKAFLEDEADPGDGVSAYYQGGRGLVISLEEGVAFPAGRAEVAPGAKEQLDKIAKVIKSLPGEVKVEGHTDNKPIHSAQYGSNWELSTARAVAVVQYLADREGIDPQRLSAVGYGEYRPADRNDTEAGRAANRRVEIVIPEGGRRAQVGGDNGNR